MTPNPPSTLSHARRMPFPAAFERAEKGADSSHAARQTHKHTRTHSRTHSLSLSHTQPWKEWKKVLKYHMPDMDEAKLKDVFKEVDDDQVWLHDGTDGGVRVREEGGGGRFCSLAALAWALSWDYCLLVASLHSRRTAWYRYGSVSTV
jgi:hypothetical protein